MTHLAGIIDGEDYHFEDKCRWNLYLVKTSNDETGERREQIWMGRNANHALERAYMYGPDLFHGMLKAEAEWQV